MIRRKAFTFTPPAKVSSKNVIGLVVAHGEFLSIDQATLLRSTQIIRGHLRVLGLELVPATPRRPWWRRTNKNRGGSQ